MTSFEMVKYHGKEYPAETPLRIEEVAAHFDVTKVYGSLIRSLHTEYSYGKRKLNSNLITQYPELCAANKEGVPQLWKSKEWACQFADFIIALAGEGPTPGVIEIHPPFNDYTDLIDFIDIYSCFEEKIKERLPDVEILIENRCGSVYRGGKFIISKLQDIIDLCDIIEQKDLNLKIAFDVPQIYTAHHANTMAAYVNLLKETKDIRQHIGGVHLWGKKLSETGRKVAHCGDLNTYFGDEEVKHSFLQAFTECFNDNNVRKMVLEVNSGNADLLSIISDLKETGINFR